MAWSNASLIRIFGKFSKNCTTARSWFFTASSKGNWPLSSAAFTRKVPFLCYKRKTIQIQTIIISCPVLMVHEPNGILCCPQKRFPSNSSHARAPPLENKCASGIQPQTGSLVLVWCRVRRVAGVGGGVIKTWQLWQQQQCRGRGPCQYESTRRRSCAA